MHILNILNFINERLLFPVLSILLFLAGLWFFFRLKGRPILYPKAVCRSLLKKKSGTDSPFKSAMIALAGTLGVGNIAGVAAAITSGGPGAIFWMWISSLAAMLIKYAEIVLAVRFRKTENGKRVGGAAYYIEKGIGSKKLAVLFSFLCIFSSFTVGNIVQSYAASDAMSYSLGMPLVLTGIAVAVICALVTLGGFKRISDFSAVVIPVLSAGYIILSLIIIIKNAAMLPEIMKRIIDGAFDFRAAAGGACGFGISRLLSNKQLRLGISRGLLSNEAGCGTAPTAHAKAASDSPAEQGFWGIFEVFADTVLLCSLTAFVVLISIDKLDPTIGGTALAAKAFELELGRPAGVFIGISTLIYAIASIICWSYYGTESLSYLKKNKHEKIFIAVFCLASVLGSVLKPGIVWELSDLSISMMCILNTYCVLRLSGIVISETKEYFK